MFSAPTNCKTDSTNSLIEECDFDVTLLDVTQNFPITVNITAYGVNDLTQTSDELIVVENDMEVPKLRGCMVMEGDSVEIHCTITNHTSSVQLAYTPTLIDTGNSSASYTKGKKISGYWNTG